VKLATVRGYTGRRITYRLGMQPAIEANSSSQPQWAGNKYQSKCSDALSLGNQAYRSTQRSLSTTEQSQTLNYQFSTFQF